VLQFIAVGCTTFLELAKMNVNDGQKLSFSSYLGCEKTSMTGESYHFPPFFFFNRFVATTVTPSVRRRPNPTMTAANFGIGAVFFMTDNNIDAISTTHFSSDIFHHNFHFKQLHTHLRDLISQLI